MGGVSARGQVFVSRYGTYPPVKTTRPSVWFTCRPAAPLAAQPAAPVRARSSPCRLEGGVPVPLLAGVGALEVRVGEGGEGVGGGEGVEQEVGPSKEESGRA